MGSAESTSRTNGTHQEEEERQQKSSTVVRAAATIAAVGVTAWVLSDNTDTQEEEERKQKSSNVVGAVAAIAALGVVTWGISRMLFFLVKISRMLFDNTWSPPPSGRFKMNTDATCRHNEVYNNMYGDSVKRGPAGYGGILRDHDGNWVRGFTGYIGVTDSLTAEFHGILKGLEFLDKPRYEGAILETDCQGAFQYVDQLDKKCSDSQIIIDAWHIIKKCRKLVVENKIKINLVGEKANKCADKLADFSIQNKKKYMEIQDLPNEIYDLVSEEARGRVY